MIDEKKSRERESEVSKEGKLKKMIKSFPDRQKYICLHEQRLFSC